jgi:hypothetical protein
MLLKCLLAFNLCFLGLMGLIWSTKHWVNVFIRIILWALAVANLLALMRIEGYIVKIR